LLLTLYGLQSATNRAPHPQKEAHTTPNHPQTPPTLNRFQRTPTPQDLSVHGELYLIRTNIWKKYFGTLRYRIVFDGGHLILFIG